MRLARQRTIEGERERERERQRERETEIGGEPLRWTRRDRS